MNRIARPTHCLFALCCLFLWAQIASGQRQPGVPRPVAPRQTITNYLFCSASEGTAPTLLYYSGALVTTDNVRPVWDAYLQFLQQKYAFKGTPGEAEQIRCTGLQSEAQAQSVLQGYVKRDRQDNRYQVIETGWTYPGAVTPGTPPPGGVAPSAAPGPGAPPAPAPEPAPAPVSSVPSPSAAPAPSPVNAAPQAQSAPAQNAPPAGATVAVRMIDGIDSSKDPAGKQYRAVVTRPINPGNNGFAGQVSVATVTLARKGSGWVAQLTSLIVNGQSVAVTTRSASVAGAVQNAVGGAVNAVVLAFWTARDPCRSYANRLRRASRFAPGHQCELRPGCASTVDWRRAGGGCGRGSSANGRSAAGHTGAGQTLGRQRQGDPARSKPTGGNVCRQPGRLAYGHLRHAWKPRNRRFGWSGRP